MACKKSENQYFPLRLRSKFEHKDHGFLPSIKHKRWKRWFLSNTGQTSATFKSNFYDILFEMYVNMRQVVNSDIGTQPDLLKCLNKIIPGEYYGTRYNKRKLFFIIKRIITQTQGEYIHISALYKKFHYEDIPWLTTKDSFMDQVLQANILVIQTVVKPLVISYYYYLQRLKDYGYTVVPRGQSDSFSDRSKNKILKLGHIRLVDPTESTTKKAIGSLSLYPKSGFVESEYRPIVRIYRAPVGKNTQNGINEIPVDIKAIKLKLIQMAMKQNTIGGSLKFYDKWIDFVRKSENKKRLYAIKLDLFDAFGFVDIDKLRELILRPTKEGFLLNHEVKYLLDLLSNQYINIRAEKEVYNWEHGLLQGARLSPLLCELYLSHVTKDCLKGFNMTNCFFHRTVDDIFFVTTSEDKLNEFELLVFSMELLNQSKTQRYVDEKLDDPEIVFCGKLFNLDTRETCTPHNYKEGQDMICKFKLWNRKIQFSDNEAFKFLQNAMRYATVNHLFSQFDLNTDCNSVDTVIKNIFNGMCFVAIKLICAADSIKYLFVDANDCCKVIIKIIYYILRNYPEKIERTIQKTKGKYYKSFLSEKLSKFLCYRALYVIFQRKSVVYNYKAVLRHLKVKLKYYFLVDLKHNTDKKYILTLPGAYRNVKFGR